MVFAKGAHTNDCYLDWTLVLQSLILSEGFQLPNYKITHLPNSSQTFPDSGPGIGRISCSLLWSTVTPPFLTMACVTFSRNPAGNCFSSGLPYGQPSGNSQCLLTQNEHGPSVRVRKPGCFPLGLVKVICFLLYRSSRTEDII